MSETRRYIYDNFNNAVANAKRLDVLFNKTVNKTSRSSVSAARSFESTSRDNGIVARGKMAEEIGGKCSEDYIAKYGNKALVDETPFGTAAGAAAGAATPPTPLPFDVGDFTRTIDEYVLPRGGVLIEHLGF